MVMVVKKKVPRFCKLSNDNLSINKARLWSGEVVQVINQSL